MGPQIGKGSFANVYEGRYAGTHVAIKEIYFEVASKEDMEDVIKVRHD